MILIEDQSQTFQSILSQYLSTDKSVPFESRFSDFESTEWLVSSDGQVMKISLKSPAIKAISKKFEISNEINSAKMIKSSGDFDVSFEVNTEALTEEKINKLALLRAEIMAIPFGKAFDCVNNKVDGDQFTMPMRGAEAVYILPYSDRVMVTFGIAFDDPSDAVLGKVFLQEFFDTRQKQSVQNAPTVIFGKEAPSEMAQYIGKTEQDNLHFISFVLLPRHVGAEKRSKSASLLVNFRSYLHYHIKSSKAYLHNRMRGKVTEFLKVLNRAKPEYNLSQDS